MQKLIFRLFIIYNIMLLALATFAPIGMTVDTHGLDVKLHHLAAMAVYTLLVWWLVRYKRNKISKALPFIITFIFGATIEIVQVFIPHRSGRLIDLVSNTIGIVLGYVIIVLTERLVSNGTKEEGKRGTST